jgi:putative NIF3 family GTP cyclohydrolase 1 type 2
MLIKEAVIRINAALGDIPDLPLEGLVFGSGDSPLTAIAACTVPSFATIRRAAAAGANLILTDGHPFYLYDSVWSTQISRPEPVLSSAVSTAKREFLAAHDLNVARIHTRWEQAMPCSASLGFASRLGLEPLSIRADHVVCTGPATRLDAFARALAGRALNGVRIIGDPSTSANRVAIKAGMLDPQTLARILRDPTIDTIIAGDAIEWEAVPYMQDVIATGRRAALVLTGFEVSMEPLGARIAQWAQALLAGYPVLWLSEPDQVRTAA